MFVAFATSLDPFEAQLRRMVGIEDGIVDALCRFTRPVSGACFRCPAMRTGRLDLSLLRLQRPSPPGPGNRAARGTVKRGRTSHACFQVAGHHAARCGRIRVMKTTITGISLALSLTLGFSSTAVADHRHHRGDYRGDHPGDYRGGYHGPRSYPAYRHDRPYRQSWVAPAAVLAIAGIAAGVAASTYYALPVVHVAPPPVYVPPPRPVYVVPAPLPYPPPPVRYWGY